MKSLTSLVGRTGRARRLSVLLLLLAMLASGWLVRDGIAASLAIRVTTDDSDAPVPARVHVIDAEGEPVRPEGLPFWHDAFVCEGEATVEVAPGTYDVTVEKGPEWAAFRATVEVDADGTSVAARLRRLADLKAEGWHAGDLHVHRPPGEVPLHLRAEDLSIASVQTWWNRTNPWTRLVPPDPVREVEGRFLHVLGGEDERGGGALLYHRMARPIDITAAAHEWPASTRFLEEADAAGAWIEIEKPFWWDVPLWLASGRADSVGIAHNHLQRGGVLGNEAWGRPRDTARWPGPHGNGRYTQELYYRILDAGFRLPPSAGSASGVLANPVGYNRVYVHTGDGFTWDAWWEGLRAGRCFVTNGPLLRVTAAGRPPGETLAGEAPITVRLEGVLDSRDPIRAVELVVNGEARPVELPAEIEIEESGWFLVRAIADVDETFRFASTGPWFVEIGGKKPEPDPGAASFFLGWAVERRALVAKALEDADPDRRREVLEAHDTGIAWWRERVAEFAEGVVADDRGLVARIHEFVVRESGAREASEETMRPYRGVIPLTGVPYEMVPVPGGTFTLGSPPGESDRREDEGPRREVAVAPFWMGKFEVTWAQFDPFMLSAVPRNRDGSPRSLPAAAPLPDFVSSPTTPYLAMDFGMGKEDGFPAVSMTHHAASKFCQWLSAQTGRFYRLPTEAEWEYACRAGTTTAYHFGDDPERLAEFAWYWHRDGPGQYSKVGLKKPNPWGIFDMHGNVSEWCLDQYFADAYEADRATVPAKDLYPRVFRGGSWDDDPEDLRSARRFASSEDLQRQDPELPKSLWHLTDATGLGFRLVRPLEVPSAEEMERLWNGGDVSETKEVNRRHRERRRDPIPRTE